MRNRILQRKNFDMWKSKALPKIYVLDSETDPFLYGRTPKPFVWGLYSNDYYEAFWGNENCTEKLVKALDDLEPGIIFLHNGGRFDVFYLLKYIDTKKPMLIIKSRIVVCYIKCKNGWHELRDSYKILPFGLSKYKKDEIDYKIFERNKRSKPENKSLILSYLKTDCQYTWELCTQFLERFGNYITIGGAAINELKKFHDIGERHNESTDDDIRSNYYVGARVECFQKGIIKGKINVYDVNSMYPYVMANCKHPIGFPSMETRKVGKDTFFVTAEGTNYGAFPMRTKSGIRFDVEHGIFSVSIHEWKTALELDLFKPTKILRAVDYVDNITFDKFVNFFYEGRKKAILEKDKITDLFFKYLLNNSYGKFSVNPNNFFDYKLTNIDEDIRNDGWEPMTEMEDLGLTMWNRPARFGLRQNVSTGASITGAARAVLLYGIANAINIMYCDTDCIVANGLKNVKINDAELGAWKLETTGQEIAIYGKKGYAIFDGNECVKSACKGTKITPDEIRRAANGEIIEYRQDAPTFKLDGSAQFIMRHVQLT